MLMTTKCRFPPMMRKGIVLCVSLVLSGRTVVAQSADRLEILSVPAPVVAGDPFPVTIRAVISGGVLASNWISQLRVRSFAARPAWPVISEIDSVGEAIEITNPGNAAVDLSGWELQVLSDYGGITLSPNARLRLPPASIMPAQSILTWTSRGTAPGTFPNFVSAKKFNLPSAYRLVRIYNPSGRIVDEVYFRAAVSSPDDALWRGTGLNSFPTNVTYQRIGRANHFRSADWLT